MAIIKIEKAINLEKSIFIDVRSPKEFEESHIVNAINFPVLDNFERDIVGKIYKQYGKNEAILKGLDSVGDKLKDFFEKIRLLQKEYNNLVLYCARGGMRSETLYSFAKSIGISNIYKLEGGYKAYRNYVIENTDEIIKQITFIEVHGKTGCGKTKILSALKELNMPSIDLEDLAKNAGSVFGSVPYKEKPPTQKMFENLLFEEIKEKPKYVFIESESKRIGSVTLSNDFFKQMNNGLHVLIETSIQNRVDIIRELYKPELKDSKINSAINNLRKRLSNDIVDSLLDELKNENYDKVIRYLSENYYDSLYEYSIKKLDRYDLEIYYEKVEDAVKELKNYYEEVVNIEKK